MRVIIYVYMHVCLQVCIQELQGGIQTLVAQIEGNRQDLSQVPQIVQVCSSHIVCMCVCMYACLWCLMLFYMQPKCVLVLTICIPYP